MMSFNDLKKTLNNIGFNTIILDPITDCSAGPLKRILQLNLVFIVKLHRGMVWHQPSLISASEAKELFECKKSGWQCHHNHLWQYQLWDFQGN